MLHTGTRRNAVPFGQRPEMIDWNVSISSPEPSLPVSSGTGNVSRPLVKENVDSGNEIGRLVLLLRSGIRVGRMRPKSVAGPFDN